MYVRCHAFISVGVNNVFDLLFVTSHNYLHVWAEQGTRQLKQREAALDIVGLGQATWTRRTDLFQIQTISQASQRSTENGSSISLI